MSAGTVGSTSTYVEGKGVNFAKSVASKVLDAAVAAKNEKKEQEKILAEGGTIPEKDQKGLFGRALKEEFVNKPIRDVKKSINKKILKTANVVGIFGKGGRKLENKLEGIAGKFKTGRGGFDRSGYKRKGGGEGGDGTSAGGSGKGVIVKAFGEIVVDIQHISKAVSGVTGLLNKQLGISYKMSGGLASIKNILAEQAQIQEQKAEKDQEAQREASMEQGQADAGTVSSTSTIGDGGGFDIMGIMKIFDTIKSFFKSIPETIGNALKGIIEKLPGGKTLLKTFGKGAAEEAGTAVAEGAVEGGAVAAAEGGAMGILGTAFKTVLRPILKRIPIFGGILDFFVSWAMGEPIGKAAAKGIGSALGSALFGLISAVFPPAEPFALVGGGMLGDFLGGWIYDRASEMLSGGGQKKMAAGGVMIGEAGPEMVTSLHSADGQKALGGNDPTANNPDLEDAYQQPYNAVAGGMLAVTKDFIDGLGPIGSSVAPVISDDVDKLGRVFDLPATATKIEVGGPAIRANKNADREGKKYMEDLVKGSLDKIVPNKDKKDNTSGGSGGSSGGDGGGGGGSGGDSGSPSSPTAPSPTSGAPQQTADQYAAGIVKNTKVELTGEGRGHHYTIQDKNLAPVTDAEKGGNTGDYYYDKYGQVYKIDINTQKVVKASQKDLENGVQQDNILKALFYDRKLFFRKPDKNVVACNIQSAPANSIELSTRKIVKDNTGRGGVVKTLVAPTADQIAKFGIDQIKSPYGSASGVSAEGGVSVLSKLGDSSKMVSAPQGRCVTGVLDTMQANGVPNPAGTSNDSNNPRGLAVQLIKSYGWGSIPGLGTKTNLQSAYGNVGVNSMDFGQWKDAVKSNKVPSGAIVFSTKYPDWTSNQSHGNDAAIAKQGGRKLWSGHWQAQIDNVGAVYGSATNKIIALTPGGQSVPYDGSTSGDSGSDSGQTSSDPFEAMNKSIEALSSGIALLGATSKGTVKDEAGYKALQEQLKSSLSGSGATETAPSGSAAPSPAKPPTAPAAAATAETPKPRTAPTSTAPALHPPTPQPTPTIQKQNMTAAGMSSYSFADIDSSAMKYKPYSMISLVENG